MRQDLCQKTAPVVHGQSRQPGWQTFILHFFRLRHFVSMYGDCFLVLCARTSRDTIRAWQSLTFFTAPSGFGKMEQMKQRLMAALFKTDSAK
jgi:hypothetical protein